MELTFEVHDGAGDVPRARHAVTSALREDAVRADFEAVELVLTELLTNALLHGAGPVTVRTTTTHDDVVRVEVSDSARSGVPHRVETGPASETGRGLLLVSVLASRWGVLPTEAGKTVWAEIDGQPLPRSITLPTREPRTAGRAQSEASASSASHRSRDSHAAGSTPERASIPVGQSRTTSQ